MTPMMEADLRHDFTAAARRRFAVDCSHKSLGFTKIGSDLSTSTFTVSCRACGVSVDVRVSSEAEYEAEAARQ